MALSVVVAVVVALFAAAPLPQDGELVDAEPDGAGDQEQASADVDEERALVVGHLWSLRSRYPEW